MTKYLFFLLSLCLLPFISFSSTNTFTSQNPIALPTNATYSSNRNRQVHDTLGRGINPRSNYRITSSLWGALSGEVYLDHSPNSGARCPDGVFKHPANGRRGTPLRFIEYRSRGNPPRIHEYQDINIQFIGTRNCDDFTAWKVGEYDATLEASLLGTSGGTIGQRDSSWFKIARSSQGGYHLWSCPGPFECPSCSLEGCRPVWVIMQNGRRRLALARNQTPPQQLRFPLSVNFIRA